MPPSPGIGGSSGPTEESGAMSGGGRTDSVGISHRRDMAEFEARQL